jgi:hypothetical protein
LFCCPEFDEFHEQIWLKSGVIVLGSGFGDDGTSTSSTTKPTNFVGYVVFRDVTEFRSA